jgi:hypothetical protein
MSLSGIRDRLEPAVSPAVDACADQKKEVSLFIPNRVNTRRWLADGGKRRVGYPRTALQV